MRIKGLILFAVMVVVTAIYLAGERFGCSGRSNTVGESSRAVPAPSFEKK
jgi:hypothetical protein